MFCLPQPSAHAFANIFFVLETSKMSLVAYAAERTMVFDLVVLVTLLVGVVLGVPYQKFRAETLRVRRTCLFSCLSPA